MTNTAPPPAAAQLLNGEQLYSFTAIAPKIPGHRGNAHTNASTVFRWVTRGVRTASGEVVKLEAVRLGTSWKTSLEAVARFSAKLTEAATATPSSAPVATPKQYKRAADKASREADAIFGAKS
jgi:hypothetical protein